MTDFEKHIGESLPTEIMQHLKNATLFDLENQAQELLFKSWCPVTLEGDSPQLRFNLKKSSELLFKFIKYKSND